VDIMMKTEIETSQTGNKP